MSLNKMETMNAEPQLDPYFDRVPIFTATNLDGSPKEIRNRADIACFDPNNTRPAVLVDVTAKSPLCAHYKKYYPGGVAEDAVKLKLKDYRSHHVIDDTTRARIFFFAMETSGAPSKEAKRLCKELANLSNAPYSVALQRIYQRLSVDFQINIAQQVNFALNYQSPPPPIILIPPSIPPPPLPSLHIPLIAPSSLPPHLASIIPIPV